MSRIVDFIHGWFGTINDNELEVVSTFPDPTKIRLAVNEGQVESNLGAISFNSRRETGTHDEHAYIQGRLTPDHQAGAVYMAVRPSHQQDCREVLYLDSNMALFRVPVVAEIKSQDQRFRLIMQNDGNLVIYDDHTNRPIWASGSVVA